VLGTNILSHIIKGDRPIIRSASHFASYRRIVISAVTEGELLSSLAKRNYPGTLTEHVKQFPLRVDVLTCDHYVTRAYSDLRVSCEVKGRDAFAARHDDRRTCGLGKRLLVTRDKAFSRVKGPLKTEDWSA